MPELKRVQGSPIHDEILVLPTRAVRTKPGVPFKVSDQEAAGLKGDPRFEVVGAPPAPDGGGGGV